MKTEKYIELRRRVIALSTVHKRLANKARAGDNIADAALVAVKIVLKNAQGELHRHVRNYGVPVEVK